MLSSIPESRLPLPSIVRGNAPILQSVSDSAVEWETLPRERVSFDSDRGSSIIGHQLTLAQVSILLLLGPRTRIRGYCLRMVRNHSSNFSQTKKNDAETSRSRTQARPYPRPLLRMSYHATAHSLTVSPHSMFMPEKSPSYPSIPSASPPLSHSTHSRDVAVRAQPANTRRWRQKRLRHHLGPTFRVRMYLGFARFHNTHILYLLSPASILPACSAVPPAGVLSRVSRIFQDAQDATVSQPQLVSS